MKILQRLQRLTPVWQYYPRHLQKMQSIKFALNIPFLAQHPVYQTLVENIVAYNEDTAFLFETEQHMSTQSWKYRGEEDLLERARIRWSAFVPEPSIVHHPTNQDDEYYEGRDVDHGTKFSAAYSMALTVHDWPDKLHVDPKLWLWMLQQECVGGFNESLGDSSLKELCTLRLGHRWGSVLNMCTRASRAQDDLALTVTFTTLAFGQPDQVLCLRTLFAFAVSVELRALIPPFHSTYSSLSRGYNISQPRIQDIFQMQVAKFDETGPDAEKRYIKYDADLLGDRQRCLESLYANWPGPRPILPPQHEVTLVDVQDFAQDLRSDWVIWFQNHGLFNFADQALNVLVAMEVEDQNTAVPDILLTAEASVSGVDQKPPSLLDLTTGYHYINHFPDPDPLEQMDLGSRLPEQQQTFVETAFDEL